MRKLYEFYLKHVKHTKYVPLSYEHFGDMLTNLDYIIEKDEHNIHGLLLYGVNDYVDINLIIGKEESYKVLLQKLILKTSKAIRIHHQKPYHLSWYAHHEMIDPNYLGVPYPSYLHTILLELGFKETSIQDSYFLDLKTFKPDRTTTERLESLNYQGYDIALYNPTKHTHLNDFIDKLQSQTFKETLLRNQSKQRPNPLLIVSKDHRVMGFAGPLYVTDDFRGAFSGIEILKDVRGIGLGKLLFSKLCQTLKQMGASYMTLFTSRNNVSKFIYLKLGFKVSESFSMMLLERS